MYESRLEQTIKQSNIFTQKQVEGLEILSMGVSELMTFVSEEQMKNPMLELEDNYEFREFEQQWKSPRVNQEENDTYYDIPAEEQIGLIEYLTSQIPINQVTQKQAVLLVKMIQNIDPDTGYFSDDYDGLKATLDCSAQELDDLIKIVQEFDPCGVGVFDLKECLLLQLKRKGELNPQIEEIILNYLEKVASGKISSLTRKLHISRKLLDDYIGKIRSLDPKPVKNFGTEKTGYIIPDVVAEYKENKWIVKMTASARSFVKFNKSYIQMSEEAKDPELISYFAEKTKRAQEIMGAIEQREDTIKNMIKLLLDVQTDYLLGNGEQKYWTQKRTAEILGVHPSTVNRAVKNKYILVPKGLMEIKELFSNRKNKDNFVEKSEKPEEIIIEEIQKKFEWENKVTEICLIAPTKQLMEQNRRVCDKYDKNVDSFQASLTEACNVVENLTKQGAKVFISRRGTKKIIEEQNIPIVEIGFSLSDYIPYMEKAKRVNGKVAFFSYGIISEDVRSMCYLLGIDALYYCFYDLRQCEEIVKEAKNDGVVLAIGGADTAVAAKKYELEHLVVENSEQSLLHAIGAAEQLLRLQKEEKKKQEELKIKLERYELVFNYTHDAIVAVDENGTVSVLNSRAEQLVNSGKKPYVGKKISEIIADTKMEDILRSGKKELNELMNMKGTLVSTNRIPIIVDNKIKGAVATFQDVKTIQNSEQKIRVKLHAKGLVAKYHFNDIIGTSEEIQDAIRMAEKFSKSNATILIHGESGTGKELFAQSIHNSSERKAGPFVAVNCGSLPKNILEAELFGYEDGAFTGAKKGGKIGLFEMAHGGTIFLDEIGEMPLETQVQLLRVLQEKEIRRLGSDYVTPVDIRVITATNRDLPEEIKNGHFREDLYYRLNVLDIEIPPLRERMEDVIAIGKNTYKTFDENPSEGIKVVDKILKGLEHYSWPGNVRELHNLMERIYVLYSQGESVEFIEKYTRKHLKQENNVKINVDENPEKISILSQLQQNQYEMTKTAEALGISRSTLWRKMKKYNIVINKI